MNIVIVGGGTAGWMTAGWLIKKHPKYKITVIESPDIPKIGVGESVTPHVASFFNEMGVPVNDWMFKTGSIYKFANKFVNWKEGKGEYEYFSFNYTTDSKLLYRDIPQPVTKNDWLLDYTHYSIENKTTDLVLELLKTNQIDKFDKFFNSQFHYMEKNVSPFEGDMYLLNSIYSQSQHINADLAADYIRDNLAVPNGVKHIQSKATKVEVKGENVSKLILESGETITGDLFVDCSGFKRLLVSKLKWKEVPYKDNPIDSAWVCQLEYDDVNSEMVNYTQSIAQNYGWLFKIGLYHRMGSGYCFSSSHISDEKALEEFTKMVSVKGRTPRLIKWTPSRLECASKGNTFAVGLSSGFVEPMEANALFVIVNSVSQLSSALTKFQQTGFLNFDEANEKVMYSIDDIADFIKVHYTLSSRTTNDFWNDMRALGAKDDHENLIYEKYHHKNNYMYNAVGGYSLFPDYMWAQLATSWGIDTTKWYNQPKELTLELSSMFYLNQEKKHALLSSSRQNNYQWLKSNVFKDLSNVEWRELVKI